MVINISTNILITHHWDVRSMSLTLNLCGLMTNSRSELCDFKSQVIKGLIASSLFLEYWVTCENTKAECWSSTNKVTDTWVRNHLEVNLPQLFKFTNIQLTTSYYTLSSWGHRHGEARTGLPFPNSWSTDFMSIITWLFYAAMFWVAYYIAINNQKRHIIKGDFLLHFADVANIYWLLPQNPPHL